jgi:uncharacterized protein YndB with AHSA1/START domain
MPNVDPHELVSSRLFPAPRAAVYRAFSDPQQLAQWWGPKGFRNTFTQFDLRPGGAWRFTMHGPDGTDYPNAKDFLEVQPEEHVSFRHAAGVHGFVMSIRFAEPARNGETLVTWRMRFDSSEELAKLREIIAEKNEENLDRLAAHLSGRAT